jgi:hypothetical protein
MKPLIRQTFLAALVFTAAFVRPSPVQAHKDDYLGDTFVFLTLGRGEVEIESWLDRQESGDQVYTAAFEAGFTDHLMADVALRYLHEEGGATAFDEGFVELRRRFGEEGDHVVDLAASIELAREDDHTFVEPQLILSKDFHGWNATANLAAALDLDKSRTTFAWSAGARTPTHGRWNFGLEVQHPAAGDGSTLVLPQAWFHLGEDSFLKAGTGITVSGDAESFVRIALEIEL